ncbi:hypothetical protein HDU97_007917 [Phlyctochytrium planicorne]|nr:hypothetical protein HDU97_007917 [Phlyctochytrium planicorne]
MAKPSSPAGSRAGTAGGRSIASDLAAGGAAAVPVIASGAGIINPKTTSIKVKIPASWNKSPPSSSPKPPARPPSQASSASMSIATSSSSTTLQRSQSPISNGSSSASSDKTIAAGRSSVGFRNQPPTKNPVRVDSAPKEAMVNEKAMRRVLDLEILNDSLLAVNSSLEDTIRDQSRKMEQMSKRIAYLTRRVGGFDDFGYDDDDVVDSGLERWGRRVADGGDKLQMVEGLSQISKDPIRESQELAGESSDVEKSYKRVCAVLNQLIDDGKKAIERDCVLVSTITSKEGELTICFFLALDSITQANNLLLVHPVESALLPLPESIISPPPLTPLSTSPTQISPDNKSPPKSPAPSPSPSPTPARLASKRSQSKLSPATPQTISNRRNQNPTNTSTRGASSATNNNSNATRQNSFTSSNTTLNNRRRSSNNNSSPPSSPSPPQSELRRNSNNSNSNTNNNTSDATLPSSSPYQTNAETLLKKARLVVASRRAFLANSRTNEQRDAQEDALLTHPPVQIPASLYGTIVELVNGVHQDLMGSSSGGSGLECGVWTGGKYPKATGGGLRGGIGGGDGIMVMPENLRPPLPRSSYSDDY